MKPLPITAIFFKFKKILLIFALFSHSACQLAAANNAPHIKVHGLMTDKAIISVNRQHLTLRKGQTINGITLISANSNGAVISVNGKQKLYKMHQNIVEQGYLDSFIGNQKSLSKEQRQLLAGNALIQAKSHIVRIKLITQSENSLDFKVDYFYRGEHGANARLKAIPMFNNLPIDGIAHSYTAINIGRDYAYIKLFSTAQLGRATAIDTILFELQGTEAKDGKYVINRKFYPFSKIWPAPKRQKKLLQ